jgi:hypothetical protein
MGEAMIELVSIGTTSIPLEPSRISRVESAAAQR